MQDTKIVHFVKGFDTKCDATQWKEGTSSKKLSFDNYNTHTPNKWISKYKNWKYIQKYYHDLINLHIYYTI